MSLNKKHCLFPSCDLPLCVFPAAWAINILWDRKEQLHLKENGNLSWRFVPPSYETSSRGNKHISKRRNGIIFSKSIQKVCDVVLSFTFSFFWEFRNSFIIYRKTTPLNWNVFCCWHLVLYNIGIEPKYFEVFQWGKKKKQEANRDGNTANSLAN